jgi:formylglycine-generating enzyme required for sulfatase activity
VIKYQLAAATLAIWENDVRRFAPDEHLRWQTLLEALPDDISPEGLRDALAPIAAKSDKEQSQFVEIFEQAKTAVKAINEQDEAQLPRPTSQPIGFWKKYGRRLTIAIQLAAIAFLSGLFIWNYFGQRGKPERLKIYASIPAKTSETFCPDSLELTKVKRDYGTQNGLSPIITTRFGTYDFTKSRISTDGCFTFTAKDTSGFDSIRTQLFDFGHGIVEADIFIEIVKNQTTGNPEGQPQLTYRFTTHPPPFNHDQLLRNLAFKPADPLTAFFAQWANWLKAGLLLILAGLLYIFVQWRARRRQKLIAQRDKSAKPPYIWNIRIKNLPPPDPGEAFGGTINALRRRTDDESRLIDLPETIRATIRKGGMAIFRYRQQTRPPEYLMLVDRQHATDHRARLYDDLYHILRQNEVLVDRFFFDGDIRLCYNDEHPDGLAPDELLFRFPNHRLLIIGAGRQMFSATTGRLAKWTESFGRWKDRALLSPLPFAEWGRRERALADLFRFTPATLPGIRRLIDAFEADEALGAAQFDKLAPLAFGDPILLEDGDLLLTLDKHFPDPLTRTWLAACALWPELHYDLTGWLGQWLTQETGQPVATMARLGDLLRLPWFATGEMPDPARAILIDWLRQTRPDLENHLRIALHSLLEDNAPPAGSAAWDDFAMRVAFNEWQFTTDPKRKKALEDQIARWIDRNGDPDFIVIRELTGKPGPLDSLLPDSWKKRLFKGKMPGLGLRDIWRDVLGLGLPVFICAAIALWLSWRPQIPACSEGLEKVVVGRDTLSICPASPEGRLLLAEYRLRSAAQRKDATAFDSLSRVAFAYNSNLLPEALANVSNEAFNTGVPFYQNADILIQNTPGAPLNISILKSFVCNWFDRAIKIDTSLAWVRDGAAWCTTDATQQNQPTQPTITPTQVPISPTSIPLPVMINIKGGTFTMGCTDEQGSDCYSGEKPAHQVALSDYAIGKTEVTVGQYMAFVEATKSHYPEWLEENSQYNLNTGTDDHYKKLGTALQNPNNPIVGISWNDAVAYCQWLSQKTGRKYRLPSEAEWEYAARGGEKSLGSGYKYAGSNNLDDVAWYTDNSGAKTHGVAQKKPNALGIYDLSGNVYEWCSDWYGNYEDTGKPVLDPVGPGSGSFRVFRGGSWLSLARDCRVSYRNYYGAPVIRSNDLGFRLASSPQ